MKRRIKALSVLLLTLCMLVCLSTAAFAADVLFKPNDTITRGDLVLYLWAAEGSPAPKSTEHTFTDVPAGDRAAQSVCWVTEQGIMGGMGANLFGYTNGCTHAQVATFLWAAADKPGVNGSSGCTDVSDSDWYASGVL